MFDFYFNNDNNCIQIYIYQEFRVKITKNYPKP